MRGDGYPVFSANRSPAEDVEAHAVGEDRSGPRSVMARQRLIDNVKEALGNVASQTRAVSGRAAKAVGWQAPKKGGATKAAAGNRSAAKRTSIKPGRRQEGPGSEGNSRHARRPRNNRRNFLKKKKKKKKKKNGAEGNSRHARRPENRRKEDDGQNAQPGENPGPEDRGQGCREEGSCQETQSEVMKATPRSRDRVISRPIRPGGSSGGVGAAHHCRLPYR